MDQGTSNRRCGVQTTKHNCGGDFAAHAPQRREARVANKVGSHFRFQGRVIKGKVASDLVVPLMIPLQLTHLDPH